MKTLTVILVVTVLVIHISGYLIQVPTLPTIQYRETAPVQWLHIQKLVLPLFENVCEDSSDPVIHRLALDFTWNPDEYKEPDAITNLKQLKTTGLLPKGKIFSEYNPEHMRQLKIIYDVLYSAKTFDAFYKAAAWARQNLNCGLYVNAIYMTIQSRRDTERLSIPAPYEVLPNYFVRKDVLIQASSILAGQQITPTEAIRDEGNAYHIDANYTAMFYDNDDESKLAYFREDIGLNSYYFLRKIRLSPWLNDDINNKYGENLYQMMKQFMARYNLERYANGLPEIDGVDWNSLQDVPYDPELIYSDGNEFLHRTSPLEITENEDLTLLQTIENNISTVVAHMRQSGYNKTQILNHLMEILVTGDRSYETLARQLLGKDRTNNGHVSVLEHYMTSLRDPMFWKINKKIVDLVDSALNMLPTYSRNELYFPGVEVVNIDVKKMMTAYDYFEFDVTDALKLDDSKSTFNVKIGQPRLNHKPFTMKLNISSLVTKKGLIKIYLGPKLLPGELASKKNLFTLLDMFEINLKIGSNIITRTSDDMKHFSSDFMSLKTIRKKVEDAEFGLDSLPLNTIESQIGYPTRLILPKGSTQGLPLQIFVFVAPFTKASLTDSYSTNTMEFNSAILSPGYPLDLMIEDRQLFSLPNALIKYVMVTQKGDSKVENYGGPGVTKQWYGTSSYDPSSRPSYSADNKKPYDYGSKKRPVNTENDSVNENEYSIMPEKDFSYPSVIPLVKELDPKSELQDSMFEDTTRTLKSFKYDNEPLDYKSKFDKKDYTAKKVDYSKYRATIPKEVVDISTISTPVDDDIDSNTQENTVVVKRPLLKSSSYDYSSKSNNKETFDYKAKKAQFDKKDYSAKRGDYSKYRTITPKEEENTSSTVIATLNEDIEANTVYTTPRLSKSSKFDYSSKRKEFDYKAKKAQFDKKDFSAKRGDYTKYRTITPKEDTTTTSTILVPETNDELARIELNQDVNNVHLINEIKDNDKNVVSADDTVNGEDFIDILPRKWIGIDPFPTDVKKRMPTVYDFLFHTFDYEDSPELKVYE